MSHNYEMAKAENWNYSNHIWSYENFNVELVTQRLSLTRFVYILLHFCNKHFVLKPEIRPHSANIEKFAHST